MARLVVSVLTRSSSRKPKILVRHFAATKPQCDFHLVAFFEKPADGFHFDVVIMLVDSRTKLDLLDLDDLLFLAGFGGFFLLKKSELAIIENLADRGIGSRDDFDEIKSRVIGGLLGLNRVDDAAVLAFGVN